MAADVDVNGITQELLASSTRDPEQAIQQIRLSARGEQYTKNLWNGMQALAIEGSYWMAATATPGTGITATVATGTTFSDTQALILINNNDAVSQNGKMIILDFISFIITGAPTGSTNWHVAHRVDSAIRGTAGTQLGAVSTTPRPVNMNIAGTAVGQVYALGASAVSVAASANVRNVGRNQLRTILPVLGDTITIKFGSSEMASGGVGLGTAAAQAITVFAPPVVIGPQQSYVLNEWSAARSAAISGEIVVGWIER